IVLPQGAKRQLDPKVVEVIGRLAGRWSRRGVTVSRAGPQVDDAGYRGRRAQVGGGVVGRNVGDAVGQYRQVVDVPDGGLQLHFAAAAESERGVDGAGVVLGDIEGVADRQRHPVDVAEQRQGRCQGRPADL